MGTEAHADDDDGDEQMAVKAGGRLPAIQRRRQLLNVAIEQFGRTGFHDTSMNALAKSAGVTKPVLYQHFPSKRHLYLAVLNDIGTRLREALEASVEQATSPHSQVEAGFRSYFSFFANEPAAFDVLFGDGSRRDPMFAKEAQAVESSIAENVASHITIDDLSPVDRRVLAFGIVGMAEGTSRYWMARGLDIDADHLAKRLANLAWYGLRGMPGTAELTRRD